MGTGNKRGDVWIGEIALLDGGETGDGGIIVGCANGRIKISVLCWWFEQYWSAKRSKPKVK